MGLRDRISHVARRVLGGEKSADRGPNWPKAPSADGLLPLLWDHEVGYDRVTAATLPDGTAGVVVCCRRGTYALRGVDAGVRFDRDRGRLVAGSKSWDLFTGKGEGASDATTYAARSQGAVTWVGGPHSPPSVIDRVEVALQPLVVTLPAGAYPSAVPAWRDLVPGEGPGADAASVFDVDYVGVMWSTGQVYDSTWRRKRRYKVDMKAPNLLEGWRVALPGLRPGGVRLILVPPYLGYGEEEIEETVPAGETLVFVIQRA